jgi:hypothetical protein
MTNLTRLTVFAPFWVLIAVLANASTAQHSQGADKDAAAESLAAQLRTQGFRCDKPVTAERDAARSKPDQAAWVVKCANASYRMRLTPDMAAKVEPLN